MQTDILQTLTDRGYHVRAIPIHHIKEIQQTYDSLHEDGSLAQEVYDEVMQYISFQPPVEMPEPKSVIILAIANRPHMNLTFQWKGRQVPVTLPNAYLPGMIKREAFGEDVGQALAKFGFRCVRAALPDKTLAVRSGLARYGRNNISYVEGLGNFHRLISFYTDMPCMEDSWQEPRMLKKCESCRICQNSCPTGAISGDRFLIHAERCITFFNEKDLDVHFPDWFEPAWHTCLAGCLQCQKVCPENRAVLRYIDGVGFNEEETGLFLTGVIAEKLPSTTREKLERNGMLNVLEVLPRNLAVLLND